MLDWTVWQLADGKPGSTFHDAPPIFERLSIDATVWCKLAGGFGRLFWNITGRPQTIDGPKGHCFFVKKQCPLPHFSET